MPRVYKRKCRLLYGEEKSSKMDAKKIGGTEWQAFDAR